MVSRSRCRCGWKSVATSSGPPALPGPHVRVVVRARAAGDRRERPAAAAMLSITDIMTFVDPGWTTGRAVLFGGGCAALLALAPSTMLPLPKSHAVGLSAAHRLMPGELRKLAQDAIANR